MSLESGLHQEKKRVIKPGDEIALILSGAELAADEQLDEDDQMNNSAWKVYDVDQSKGTARIYMPHVGKTPEECGLETRKLSELMPVEKWHAERDKKRALGDHSPVGASVRTDKDSNPWPEDVK